MTGRKPLEGGLGETSRDALDDGKRASAAIEVLRATAQRLSRGAPDFRVILDGLTCLDHLIVFTWGKSRITMWPV